MLEALVVRERKSVCRAVSLEANTRGSRKKVDRPALLVPLLEANRPQSFSPTTGNDNEISRTLGKADLDFAIVPLQGIVCADLTRIRAFCRGMHHLVINPLGCTRSCPTELVDADPSQSFLDIPRIVVRPIVQLIVNPRQERDGGVFERVGEGLRSGRLFQIIACSNFSPSPLGECWVSGLTPSFFLKPL